MEPHEVQRPPTRVTRYVAPSSVPEAVEILAANGERARIVAGGTDLLVELDRGARPGVETMVDVGRIPDLDLIEVDETTIRLGALVTHNQVVADERCVADALPLAQACLEVGSAQLRNRATVAGNVVTASPANDTISALTALGASIEIVGPRGTRTMPIGDFITGFRTTALADGELVTAVLVPRLDAATRGVFVKLGLRRAQAISVVHLAVAVTFANPDAPDQTVIDASTAIGSVAPTVIAVPAVGEALRGRPLDRAAIADAADAAVAAAAPIDDLRSTASYRIEAVRTMTRRALEALATGTQADRWPAAVPKLWARGFDGRFPAGSPVDVGADTPITASINGHTVTAASAVGHTLLDWLRDEAGLTGVKEGCAEGECGACTVELDGAAVMSCLVPAARAAGARVTTVEGLAGDTAPDPSGSAGARGGDGALGAVQDAFVAAGAVQCGFCTPGFLVACDTLLDEIPAPDRAQVCSGLAGNLCRCTGYSAIETAVGLAAASAR